MNKNLENIVHFIDIAFVPTSLFRDAYRRHNKGEFKTNIEKYSTYSMAMAGELMKIGTDFMILDYFINY